MATHDFVHSLRARSRHPASQASGHSGNPAAASRRFFVLRRLVASLVLVAGLGFAGRAVAQEAPAVIAQFTTGIENREPVDQISFVRNDVRKVFFFSDLRGLAGTTIVHRWIHDDQTMAEVRFEVAGPRWRVWSSKDMMPDWIGDWTVEVVTNEGEVLAAETFTYTAPES